MKDNALRTMSGVSALVSVAIWLAIFPLYTLGDPSVSLFDGEAIAQDLFRLQTIVLTRILLGLLLYVPLMLFAVGFRELVRRADANYEWLGTLSFGAMAVWVGVTLVANGLEGGAVLDAQSGHGHPAVARALTMGYLLIYNSSIAFIMTALYMGAAAFATLATRILPRWTAWLAWVSTASCVLAIPTMYNGPADPTGFYNAAGWGAALIANFPPLLWFLAVGINLLRKGPKGLAAAGRR
jgi:hypothetical protein